MPSRIAKVMGFVNIALMIVVSIAVGALSLSIICPEVRELGVVADLSHVSLLAAWITQILATLVGACFAACATLSAAVFSDWLFGALFIRKPDEGVNRA